MTKICPKCKTANPDNSGFCQECGTELEGANSAIKSNETTGDGVRGFWNKQNNGGKAAIIIGVCCVGLILIVAIGGMLSPDKTTTTPATTNTTTTPATTTTTPATTNDTTTPDTTSSSSSSSSGVEVQVSGSGSWSGSYGDTSGQQSVDGSGTQTFQMDNPDIVSAVFQKKSGGSGTLTVEIIENGNVVESKSTSAEYGVVTVSHSFY